MTKFQNLGQTFSFDHFQTIVREALQNAEKIFGRNPVGTRFCDDIGFLLDLHRDIDRLHIEIEVTSLYDIFFPTS